MFIHIFTHIPKSSCLPYIFYTFVFLSTSPFTSSFVSPQNPTDPPPPTQRMPFTHPVTVSYSDDDFDETSDSEGDAALLAAQGVENA